MTYKNFENAVLEIVQDEDLIVCWYEVLRDLWKQGESVKEAANWILALADN